MVVFTCYDNFESMMTCIYDAWAARLGHSNIRLQTEPVGNLELFCEYRHIDTEMEKVQKVIRSIHKKISFQAYQYVYAASLSSHEEKLDRIYRFLVLGFACGNAVLDMLHQPEVQAIFELQRSVYNETHKFREFVRFDRLENQVLFSVIEPKSHVLTLLAPHFEDRMPSEDWIITDKNRLLAVVHPKNQEAFLTPITPQELAYMESVRNKKDSYTRLWKTFFDSVSIKERANAKCQRNFLPLWYRKNMTEFTEE